MDEYSAHEKQEFLSRVKDLLQAESYREALELAESWLDRDFADTDANIIRCQVLLKMGRLDRLRQVFDTMDDQISRLSHTYSFMGDLCTSSGLKYEAEKFYRKFNAINSAFDDSPEIPERLKAEESVSYKADAETENAFNYVEHVSPDFHTVTLAELYIKQGHLKMAKDVLCEIIKREPANSCAQETLEKVETMLIYEDKKAFLVKELTRWLNNIDRIRCHAS